MGVGTRNASTGTCRPSLPRLVRAAALALAPLTLMSVSAMAQANLMPEPRVRPIPRAETVPPAPGRSYAWSPGRWKWTGTHFVWVRGRYKQSRPASYRYVHGYFAGHGPMLKWIPGYFDSPARAVHRGLR